MRSDVSSPLRLDARVRDLTDVSFVDETPRCRGTASAYRRASAARILCPESVRHRSGFDARQRLRAPRRDEEVG
jgi:hypothetical protein